MSYVIWFLCRINNLNCRTHCRRDEHFDIRRVVSLLSSLLPFS